MKTYRRRSQGVVARLTVPPCVWASGHETAANRPEDSRRADPSAGLFAVSRLDRDGGETLIVYNTSGRPMSARTVGEDGFGRRRSVRGACASAASGPATVRVDVPSLDYLIRVSEG